MEQQHSIMQEGVTGGTVFDTEYFLYNVVLERMCIGSKPEVINPIPVEFDEAARRVRRMNQLKRDDANGGFADVYLCYWEPVNIPKTATEQDRWNAVWSNIANMQYADAVSKHESWLIDHYELRVEDAEAATDEDQFLLKLKVMHAKCEKSRELVDALRKLDVPNLRAKLLACFPSISGEAFAGGAA